MKATPEDHPDRAGLLKNLGNSLISRYERTGNFQDLHLAIDTMIASWSITTAPISTRIRAASVAAQILLQSPFTTSEGLSKACSLVHDATHLIPLATLRSLEREDQQYIMRDLALEIGRAHV